MGWPEMLNLIFRLGGKPCERLVIYVSLLAKKKNNYSLGPFLTNESCEIGISADYVRAQMELTRQDFPMDYEFLNLDEISEITVEIESRKSLTERYKRIQTFYPHEAMRLQELLEADVAFVPIQLKKKISLESGMTNMNITILDSAVPS